MATQKDTPKDYVVKVRGKKVNITYESSDEELCRNFLTHVVKTTILEDITISIKGPEKIDSCSVTFNMDASTGGSVIWTDTTTGHSLTSGLADI